MHNFLLVKLKCTKDSSFCHKLIFSYPSYIWYFKLEILKYQNLTLTGKKISKGETFELGSLARSKISLKIFTLIAKPSQR